MRSQHEYSVDCSDPLEVLSHNSEKSWAVYLTILANDNASNFEISFIANLYLRATPLLALAGSFLSPIVLLHRRLTLLRE